MILFFFARQGMKKNSFLTIRLRDFSSAYNFVSLENNARCKTKSKEKFRVCTHVHISVYETFSYFYIDI